MEMDTRARMVIIGVALLSILVTGGGIFYYLMAKKGGAASVPGLPATQSAPAMTAPADAGAPGAKAVPPMEVLAQRLATRLEQTDGTSEDWALLARSYVEIKRYPEATRAFEHALKKSPNDAKLLADLAAAKQAAAAAPAPR